MLYTSGRLEVLGNQFVIAFEWADISGLSVLCFTGNFATRTFSAAARGWWEGVGGGLSFATAAAVTLKYIQSFQKLMQNMSTT